MWFSLATVLFTFVLVYIVIRFLIWFAQYATRKWAKLDIKIGRIGLFCIRNISITISPALHLEVEKISISSCYFNRTFRKPVTVCFGDLRVDVDFLKLQNCISFHRPKKKLAENDKMKKPRFLWLLPFAKFVGIDLDQTLLVLNKGPLSDCILHISIKKLVSSISSKRLVVYTQLDSLKLQLLCALKEVTTETRVQPCMANLSVNLTSVLHVDPSNRGVESVNISVLHCSFTCTEGFVRHLNAHGVSRAVEVKKKTEISSHETNAFSVIPKNVHIDVGDLELVLEKDYAQRDLVMYMSSLQLNICHSLIDGEQKFNIGYGNMVMKGMSVKSNTTALVAFNHFSVTLQVDKCKVDLDVQLLNGFVGYDHRILNKWIMFFNCEIHGTDSRNTGRDHVVLNQDYLDQSPHSCTDPNEYLDQSESSQSSHSLDCANNLPDNSHCDRGSEQKFRKNLFFTFFGSRTIKISLDAVEVSGLIIFGPCELEAGVSHWKMSSTVKTFSENVESALKLEDLQYELDVTSVYCKLADKTVPLPSGELNTKQHLWNTFLYVGIVIAKGNRFSQHLTYDVMLDSLQVELSPIFLDAVDSIVGALFHPQLVSSGQSLVHQGQSVSNSQTAVVGHVQMTNMNVYLCCDNKATAMIRCDTTSLQQRAEQSFITISGVKVTYFIQLLKSHPVLRSADLQDFVFYIRSCEAVYKNVLRDVDIQVSNGIDLTWTLGLHMCFHEIIMQMTSLVVRYSDMCVHKEDSNALDSKRLSMNLSVGTRIRLEMLLPNNHSVSFLAGEVCFKRSESQMNFFCPRLEILFDGHGIFLLEGMQVSSKDGSGRFQHKRESAKSLELKKNRAVIIAFNNFQIIFPYDYNFAECLEEVKNVNKWRKIIYKKSPQTLAIQSLPSDLLITSKAVHVQLSDDPFEVKLRDIYERLFDISLETEKRNVAMERRIEELNRTQGMLSGSKISELFSLLRQKTSQDYIKGMQKFQEESLARTSLFSWTMENMEIFALADTSYNSKENVLSNMKEIDKDSPVPNDLDFVSLFCRFITANTDSLCLKLRDFPHAMLDVRDFHIWGRLIGAEPLGVPKAKRTTVIDMGAPWGLLASVRNMPQLKFFHDFNADVCTFNLAYGPCWEPTMAQVSLALNKVSRPSIDPSPPLPFWDKFRLLLHGRLTMTIQQTRWLYHASLDPYNTTEFMVWMWSNFFLDWTNAKWILNGNLEIFSKTASKYNDCRVLHLPDLKLCILLKWLCFGDPNDHHSVMPCAPDKIPEYSVQEYDSYRTFRSQNFDIDFKYEICPMHEGTEIPSCLFFASTLRWIDKIKMCLNRVSRPIRRGPLFKSVGPRKKPLSRHIRNTNVAVSFPEFQICYWLSFSKQNGATVHSGPINVDISLKADRRVLNDSLKRRPATIWCIMKFDLQLRNGIVWLCSTSQMHEKKKEKLQSAIGLEHKSFLLSVDEVSYQREETNLSMITESLSAEDGHGEPVHKVKVFNLKGSWTTSNRNVVFSLYDGYSKAQMLRANLLSEALKGFKVDANQTPKKSSRHPLSDLPLGGERAFSPQFRGQCGPVYSLLQKLIKEAGSVAVSEEISGKVIDLQSLQGISVCQTDDILRKNWDVEIFNSQVMLKGCETAGYIIVSAAKTSLLSSSHHPFWHEGQLKTKTTLIGSVECMQYYATVETGNDCMTENVRWLSKEDVEDRPFGVWNDEVGLADMAGSGNSVGGVVSDTRGLTSEECNIQLQRIISRCSCQFFWAWYGEVKDEPLQEIPIPPTDVDSDVMKKQEGVDAFTLLHYDLNICTNSLQYATVLDILNNLLLYVDPKKKELTEKLQDMRFKRHLSSREDQRTPISKRQDNLRKLVSRVRVYERELYMMHRKQEEYPADEELCLEIQELQKTLEDTKDKVNMLSEELSIMVSCFKESQVQVMSQRLSSNTEKEAIMVRRIDLYFQHATWRMTEADGQIGIADLVLSNFLYTNIRTTDNDTDKTDSGSRHLTDSGSHHLELGWFKVTNLLPNSVYMEVLAPQDSGDAGFTDKQVALRVYCQFESPVGGISVKKHFEVNVVPLTIQLTTRFYMTVMSFFFPGKPVDSDDELDPDTASVGSESMMHVKAKEEKKDKKRVIIRGNKSIQSCSNDIDKMKERAAKNNLFVSIKIPEVPLRVSYKSENEKLIPNIHDFRFVLPRLEYHNQTWMWHDLAMAIKSDCKKVIVPQVFKHKLHIKTKSLLPETEEPGDSDPATSIARKAQVLFGSTLTDAEDKPSKKKYLIGKHNK